MKRYLLVSVCLILLTAANADADIHIVRPDGAGDFPNIRAAIDAALDGDEILLGEGVFTGVDNRGLDLTGKSLTIRSQFDDPGNCVIDCEGSDRWLRVSGQRTGKTETSICRLERIGVRNGFVSADGGGIHIEGGVAVAITGCIFEACHADVGGAVMCDEAVVSIVGSRFDGNGASHGGAFGVIGAGELEIHSTHFAANNAVMRGGAGVMLGDFDARLIGCLFDGNHALSGKGGALFHRYGGPGIENCYFTANRAQFGGAVYTEESGRTLLSNCVFEDNQVPQEGGAIFAEQAFLDIGASRFTGNTAGDGAAIHASTTALYLSGSVLNGNRTNGIGSILRIVDNSHPRISGTTIHGNAAPACFACEDLHTVEISNTLITFNDVADVMTSSNGWEILLECCDVYGNQGGDDFDNVERIYFLTAHLNEDPLYCDPSSSELYVMESSPCLPANNPCGLRIGAFGEVCGTVAAEEKNWSAIKAMY